MSALVVSRLKPKMMARANISKTGVLSPRM
jgi:hypothetical protein